jgi:hypothetical protein
MAFFSGGVSTAEDRATKASFTANVTTQGETTTPTFRTIPIAAISAGRCVPGYYSPPNSSDQVKCPSGYYCTATGAGQPIPCPAGTYCPEGASSTTPCSAGHYCPEKSWRHNMCPVGFYCSANTATQTKCRAGYFCPEGAMAESPCPAGYYCPEGVDVPVECSAGNMCPETLMSVQTPCPEGSYSYAKAKMCTPCLAPPNGTVSGSIAGFCTLECNDGYTKVGWRCLPPFEFAGSSNGVPSCQPCYSMNGNMCILSLTCTPTCPAGYTVGSNKMCTPCPAGNYTNPSGQCVPCGPGSTSTPASTSCVCTQTPTIVNTGYVWDAVTNACSLKCNAGYYKTSGSTCTQCPVNTYCPTGTPAPLPCPEATYSLAGSEFCHFDTGIGAGQCPAGSWASISENMCRLCPAGTYSTVVGATSQTTCLACPAGKTSAVGSRACT